MALFVFTFLIISNCLTALLGSENINNILLEIRPSTITAGQNVAFYKVDDTLNLTCIFRNESILPDVILEWVVPTKASNSQNRVVRRPGTNFVVLIIENLQEHDSGEYKCRAVHNGIPFFNFEKSVKISVKNKKKECTDVMFQCSDRICISKRYTCDGYKDCPHGEDESPAYCGPGNPCDNKLMCPDSRCIPFTWCCESHREPNCTTKIKHNCCTHVEKLTRDVDNDLGYQYEQQRFSDMGFLQTTVYTVIGCAMAFMFIVTIIVIAICRVHVRRTLLSRCPAANRNLMLGRGGNLHENNFRVITFDQCFTGLLDETPALSGLNGNDLMSVNPLLVTYNINNGVQFVGRPIDPPPYCEIVTSPPKEGPPPPYTSQENLCEARRWEKPEEPKPEAGEPSEIGADTEVTESDALLGATRQNISVISCNAIDVVPEEAQSTETPPENNKKCINSNESTSKESLDVDFNSSSSHCVADESISVGGSKNSGLDVIVLNNCDSVVAEVSGKEKVQIQSGECSSYSSGDVSDISKGAVKRIVATNSLDSPRRKCTHFSKCHGKKF